MINKFPGTCGACRGPVAAAAGQVVNEAGRWQAYHNECVPVRVAPSVGTHGGWHDAPLVAFDIEATLAEPLDARIISAALVHSDESIRTWLVDPGVPIPPDATAINGFTDEVVRRDGAPAAKAIADIGTAVAKYIADGIPLVAFRASYDVTVLHTELARHSLPAINWEDAVIIDPFILHKQVEPDWYGRRTLSVLADYYQVRLDKAHDAVSDARATLDLASAIAARHQRIAQMPLAALHEAQIRWYAEDSQSLQEYYNRRGIDKSVNGEWPLETSSRG
ncbi:MAG TPA: exonuclease domain-containing protein [Micromonospora sp.]|nr:exonuclease domain-containing protein [Micromonospora sp.]